MPQTNEQLEARIKTLESMVAEISSHFDGESEISPRTKEERVASFEKIKTYREGIKTRDKDDKEPKVK